MYVEYARASIGMIPMLASLAVASWVLYILGVAVYNVTFHPLAKFPGPKLWAAFWWPDTLSLFGGDHVHDVYALHQKYGPIVRLNPEALSFTDGRVHKDVYSFRSGKGQMRKDPRFYLQDKSGDGASHIIAADDADHARFRRLLSHAFSDQALRAQESILNFYFSLLIQKLNGYIDGPEKGKVDMVAIFNQTTFDIIGDLTFGESFHSLEKGKYHPWVANLFKSLKWLRWLRVGGRYPIILQTFHILGKMMPSLREARQRHLDFTAERVYTRLESDTDRKDFMNYILKYNDEKGMTRSEIVMNSTVLIAAGSETTATLLCGAVYFLLQHPDKLARLQEEVRGAFSSMDEMTLITTGKLHYLHAVIEESLRLYPPAPDTLPRAVPPEGAEIAGQWVPGNTSVGFHHWSAYRDPMNFADPLVFAPERFMPDPPEKYKNDNMEVLEPFSVGPRNCLGKNLAYNEMRSLLARLIYAYDMELCLENQNWMNQKAWVGWEKHPLIVQLWHKSDKV